MRPVNVGREEHEMKWAAEDSAPKEKTWVPKKTKVEPKKTKVEVQVEDGASKDNTWILIDMTTSEGPILCGGIFLCRNIGLSGVQSILCRPL